VIKILFFVINLLICIWFFTDLYNLPFGTIENPGAGFFPGIVLVLFIPMAAISGYRIGK